MARHCSMTMCTQYRVVSLIGLVPIVPKHGTAEHNNGRQLEFFSFLEVLQMKETKKKIHTQTTSKDKSAKKKRVDNTISRVLSANKTMFVIC